MIRNNSLFNISTVVYLLLFGFILLCSWMAVWYGDDIFYAFICTPASKLGLDMHPVGSLSDLITSQNYHYLNINGRYEAHLIVQTFLSQFPQPVFALCNAAMYVILVIVILRLCGASCRDWRAVLTVSLMVLLGLSTHILPSCQIGYIWMFVLSLIVLKIFRSPSKPRWWQLVLICLLSFLAGEGQEALNIGLGGAFLIYFLTHLRGITGNQTAIIISFGIGALLLCLAPGNFIRLAQFSQTNRFVISLVLFFLSSRCTYILLAIVLYRLLTRRANIRQIYQADSFLWNAWIICIIFNFYIGISEPRQILGVELISILLSIHLLKRHSFTKPYLIIFTLLTLFMSSLQVDVLLSQRRAYDDMNRQFVSANTDDIIYFDDPTINPLLLYSAYSEQFSCHYGENSWFAKMMTAYFNHKYGTQKSIIYLPETARGIINGEKGEGIYRVSDKLFVVATPRGEERNLRVRRSMNLFGHRFHFREYPADFFPVKYSTPAYDLTIVSNDIIFTSIADISI